MWRKSQDNQQLDLLLSAYLDGMLSPQERAALEARLAQDPELRDRLEGLRVTVRALSDMPVQPVPRNFILSPAMVGKRLPVPRRRPRPMWTLFGWAAAATALLLVLLFAGDWLLARPGEPERSALAVAREPGPTAVVVYETVVEREVAVETVAETVVEREFLATAPAEMPLPTPLPTPLLMLTSAPVGGAPPSEALGASPLAPEAYGVVSGAVVLTPEGGDVALAELSEPVSASRPLTPSMAGKEVPQVTPALTVVALVESPTEAPTAPSPMPPGTPTPAAVAAQPEEKLVQPLSSPPTSPWAGWLKVALAVVTVLLGGTALVLRRREAG